MNKFKKTMEKVRIDEGSKKRIYNSVLSKAEYAGRKTAKSRTGMRSVTAILLGAVLMVGSVVTVMAIGYNTGIFGRILGSEAEQYSQNINEVGKEALLGKDIVCLESTIFTDNEVFAILSVGNQAENFSADGSIKDSQGEEVYDLAGSLERIPSAEEDGDTVYYIYRAIIAPQGSETEVYVGDKETYENMRLAVGDSFQRMHTLRDLEKGTFELLLSREDESVKVSVSVENVSSDFIVLKPIPENSPYYNEGNDYYHTIEITPYYIRMNGVSKLSQEDIVANEKEEATVYYHPDLWYLPVTRIILHMRGAEEIEFISGQRYQMAIQGITELGIGASMGGDCSTGEFYADISFHLWELDVTDVTGVTVNGVFYPTQYNKLAE
ncbi:MAG: hypothetical protein E7487_10740 [Ruminococcaceae bacterium]|nr:hypothetical protein [Oscillospiraceae bacterium]